ncbi:hypothetical protein AURDEDRAFT_177140 [Auricularia subglabra TFB-10046 SS5]|uniref:Uncharacterized protein n=1 Tax=Auricularia subglabra (strain TFB-10046 / SS5) TaxID=717982 RepID=J0D4U8_AURST|nr:hypothetical protein AURDEDRAFT_177140 [Auricularia subglabra TFB-10046 SS5]
MLGAALSSHIYFVPPLVSQSIPSLSLLAPHSSRATPFSIPPSTPSRRRWDRPSYASLPHRPSSLARCIVTRFFLVSRPLSQPRERRRVRRATPFLSFAGNGELAAMARRAA